MSTSAIQPGRLRAACGWIGGLCLLGSLGCPPPVPPSPPPGPPRELADIVATIEANAARLDRPLWCSPIRAKARFTDEDGRQHAYNLDGSLLFRRPRDLRVDLRPGLGEQAMQIGSNDAAYWVWIEPELSRMWWGRYAHLGKPCVARMIVRPDELVAAIGLGGLPKPADGWFGPARKFGRDHDILYYLRRLPSGEYLLAREYWVSRAAPFLIVGVKSRDRFGRVSMSALLDRYEPAWDGGPMIPHAINILWPQDEGAFTLWLD
ncbi:MAG: hypothetical protein ACE5E1_11150, partial [Phycisphaerae bacterium]